VVFVSEWFRRMSNSISQILHYHFICFIFYSKLHVLLGTRITSLVEENLTTNILFITISNNDIKLLSWIFKCLYLKLHVVCVWLMVDSNQWWTNKNSSCQWNPTTVERDHWTWSFGEVYQKVDSSVLAPSTKQETVICWQVFFGNSATFFLCIRIYSFL